MITIVHGRHEHLRMHLRGLAASTTLPYSHIIVAMGDEMVKNIVAQERSSARVVEIDVPEGDPLPLARARNIGAAKARCHGAELLVFLDVDCIAAPTLLARYHETASEENSTASLFCGPVTYLTQPLSSPITPDEMALLHNPHPARPAPPRRDGPPRGRLQSLLVVIVRGHCTDMACLARLLRGIPRVRRRGHRFRLVRPRQGREIDLGRRS